MCLVSLEETYIIQILAQRGRAGERLKLETFRQQRYVSSWAWACVGSFVSFWYEARPLAAMHEFVNQGNVITLCEVSLVPRPKQPQRRSLAVSRGEGGSGHLTAGNADLRLVCRRTQSLVNYQILP